MREVTKVGFQRTAPRGVALAHGLTTNDPPPPSVLENGFQPHRLRALLGRSTGEPLRSDGGASPDGGGPRRRPSRRRAPIAVLPALVAIAAFVAGGPVLTALGALVLGAVAAGSGWLLGDDRRKALQREVDERNDDLRRALSELEIAQAETVRRLSMAVEFRDEDTGAHIERIGRFSTLLAEAVGMSPEFCRRISHAAPLHDVGKVAIPDSILLKPGSLTPEERAIVETHAEEGHRLLRGSSSSILDMGATIALSHHERWDGAGYPRGLAAESIPIEGRIVAIADVFDALTSHRVYREAFSVERATEMMLGQAGRHFDPVLLHAFMDVLDSSGADARTRERSNPRSLLAGALATYTDAMRLGDAETAEGAIASAIEDGIDPATLQDEVVAPAMRRIEELRQAGEIDLDTEQLAQSITRRVLATVNRYMLARG
ncbi:MAG TPA: HD domain-containing phosphohydrolase [Solirubrobacteraceae bacterium]|nr:HD domain-containing phosphohydrolase [Solirubrobacteraceae bacterium]